MKKHYFLIGTVLGLFATVGVGYWFMNKSLWAVVFSFEKYNGLLPVTCGAITALLFARLFDKVIKSELYILRGLVLPSTIFLAGVLVGSGFNMINFSEEYTLGSQVFDYVFKPIYWLSLFGLPSAWILGTAYFVIFKRLNKS